MPQATDSVDFSELMLIEALDASNVRAEGPDSLMGPRPDSIMPLAFDSVLDTARIEAYMALQAVPDTVQAVAEQPADRWTDGLAPRPRSIHPAASNGFLLTLAVLLIIGAFNIRNLINIIVTSSKELVKVRHGRDNIFTERSASDARTRLFLLLLATAGAGIFTAVGALAASGCGASMTVSTVCVFIALCAVYFGVMYVAYQTVGFTFAPGDGRREWIRGYSASLILPGFILALPAVALLFYPAFAVPIALGAMAVFLAGRLLFIIKGFRIFYDKIGDLVYFILYLCTLEIIPLLVVYRLAVHELI